jgi:hypothetical protein
VLGIKTWVRAEEEFGKRHQRKTRLIREKESVKWLEGIEHLAALKARCAETRFVGVGDRESDLYELFVAELPAGVDWLIRAAWNRRARHPERISLGSRSGCHAPLATLICWYQPDAASLSARRV